MGDCPDWYPVIKAARYGNVQPWELIEKPSIWQEWLLAAQSAEEYAEAEWEKKRNPQRR